MKKLFPIVVFAAILCSCGPASQVTRESQYAAMYNDMPVTILVMPPINNTSHVEAKDLLYTSISRPLAEAGYYVISPEAADLMIYRILVSMPKPFLVQSSIWENTTASAPK